MKEVHGTSLWEKLPGGGRLRLPSVFLVSRQSPKPDPPPDGGASAGRRGGGAAIMAELEVGATMSIVGRHNVGNLRLKYRLPGTKTHEMQETTIAYAGVPGIAPQGGYYAQQAVEKNTLVLGFYVAFRDATKLAQDDRVAARKLLLDFQARMKPRLAGWNDEDLLDDLAILQQYIDVLK